MRKYYPKKRPTKKQVEQALNLFSPAGIDIDSLPDDKPHKQRKKRFEREILEHRKFVVRFTERWPWPKGPMVVSIRDERGQYVQGEAQLQAGKKRPDIFIAKVTIKRVVLSPKPLDFRHHNFAGLFIEMKKDRNEYLTQKGEIRRVMDSIWPQYQTLLKLRRDGYAAFFAGGFDEAMSIAEWYMEGNGLHSLEYLYEVNNE